MRVAAKLEPFKAAIDAMLTEDLGAPRKQRHTARRVLARAHTLSLHYVLADRSGAIAHQQAGLVPRRTASWTGLYPVAAEGAAQWDGLYRGAALGSRKAQAGTVVSANEAGTAEDGAPLAIRGAKQAVRATDGGLQAAENATRAILERLWFTVDHREAEAAFVEKRPPDFRGS